MRYSIPVVLFTIIAIFLWKGLGQDPHKIPSALLNKPIPAFDYPTLSEQRFTNQKFLGHISLLNVWSTWCPTCWSEHAELMHIAKHSKITLYGLDYKDDKVKAQKWLDKFGNPYQEVVFDDKGLLAVDLGVYGTPETFLIDEKGVVRYKHVGPITREIWNAKILPEIAKLSR